MKKDGYADGDIYRDQLIAEVLLRITALENLLITKNIVSDIEIQEHIKLLSSKITDLMEEPQLNEATDNNIKNDTIVEPELEQVFEEFALTTRKVSKGN